MYIVYVYEKRTMKPLELYWEGERD
jgi:hypothetical protein